MGSVTQVCFFGGSVPAGRQASFDRSHAAGLLESGSPSFPVILLVLLGGGLSWAVWGAFCSMLSGVFLGSVLLLSDSRQTLVSPGHIVVAFLGGWVCSRVYLLVPLDCIFLSS
jgi:hypothetical protein